MKKTFAVLFALLVVFVPLSAMADVWGDQINDPTRFVVLASYGGAAVLDQETGLVWEQSPPLTSTTGWNDAQIRCNQNTVGNRKGWRLPTAQELASLLDPSVPDGPLLPAGHPFSRVTSASIYWAATIFAADPSQAWFVAVGNGNVGANPKNFTHSTWCVRGGQGTDSQ